MIRFEKNQIAFFALLAVSVLIGWHPLLRTFSLAWGNDEYTHILLILPVSAALILFERERLVRAARWNVPYSIALLFIAVVLAGSVTIRSASVPADVQLAAGVAALVVAWIAVFILCFGTSAFRVVLFPMLFLFALVPLPNVALDLIISALQLGSAWSAHALFAAVGVPVVQHGVIVTIPGLTIQIAQECSSIRSSSMLLVTTMVVAQLLLQSPWRKALVIALAIPLSVAKNGLRIFTIGMLGTKVDPGYLHGRLHHQGGILFFLLALFAVFAILWFLRRHDGLAAAGRSDALRATAIAN